MRRAARLCGLVAAALLPPAGASGGGATVRAVDAERTGAAWRFSVTVAHADAGWEHYADAWEVRTPEGERLGIRELLHPHDDEQPFTRALDGVRIAPDVPEVEVRARDSRHGWGPAVRVVLPR